MTTNDANENESADLYFDLAKLCEVHGQIAVINALREACHAAAEFESAEGDTPRSERMKKAGDAMRWASDDVRHAVASGSVSIPEALIVIGESVSE